MLERVHVVMPAYNAGKTIEQVFERIPEEARSRIQRYIVVDDGSTDDTWEAMQRLRETIPHFVALQHTTNKGYGAAEKTLLHRAIEENVQVAVLLHADGQYSPEMMMEMLALFDHDDAELVQGSRMLKGGALSGGMPFYKYVSNKCLTAVENLGFGMNMAEYHSGYMVYARKILDAVPFDALSNSFDFDLEMIVCAKVLGMRIREVAIPTIYADEVSHLNPIKYGLDVLSVVKDFRMGKYHRLLGTT